MPNAGSAPVHIYETELAWRGTTHGGYTAYDRNHLVRAAGADGGTAPAVALSADPVFLGDAGHLNPEQLLLAAASSCQLLEFLSLAARAHLDVVAYEDHATAEMPEDEPPICIRSITLRPSITLQDHTVQDSDHDAHLDAREHRVLRLVDLAHHGCYIANSLRTAITIEASITWMDEAGAG